MKVHPMIPFFLILSILFLSLFSLQIPSQFASSPSSPIISSFSPPSTSYASIPQCNTTSPCLNDGLCVDSHCLCPTTHVDPYCSLPLPFSPLCVSTTMDNGENVQYCMNYVIDVPHSQIYFRLTFTNTDGWFGLLFDPKIDGMTDSYGYHFHVKYAQNGNESSVTPMAGLGHAMPTDQLNNTHPLFLSYYYNSTSDIQFYRPISPSLFPPPFNHSTVWEIDFHHFMANDLILGMSYAFGPEEKISHHCNDCKGEVKMYCNGGTLEMAELPDYFLWYFYPLTLGFITLLLWYLMYKVLLPTKDLYKYLFEHRLVEFLTPRIPYLSSSSGPLLNSPRYPLWLRLFDFITLDIRSNLRELLVVEGLVILTYIVVVLTFIYLSFQNLSDFPNRTPMPLFGHLLLWNLPLLFFIPTKKSLLYFIFRIPFERCIKYHRWLVRVIIVFAMIHLFTELHNYTYRIILLKVGYYLEKGSIYGFFTFIAICIVTVFSLEPIRRNYYELFYLVHMMGIPTIIVLAILHAKAAWMALIGPVTLWAIDKLYRIYLGMWRQKVVSVEKMEFGEGDERKIQLSKIVIKLSDDHIKSLLLPSDTTDSNSYNHFGYYYYLNLPLSSFYQFHPLSLASSITYAKQEGIMIFYALSVDNIMNDITCGFINTWSQGIFKGVRRLIQNNSNNRRDNTPSNGGGVGIKSNSTGKILVNNNNKNNIDGNMMMSPLLDDDTPHTDSILVSSSSSNNNIFSPSPPLTVRLHGPYGILSVSPSSFPHLIFLSGGIGITPFLSFFHELSHQLSLSSSSSSPFTIPWESIHIIYVSKYMEMTNYLLGPVVIPLLKNDYLREKIHIHLYTSKNKSAQRSNTDNGNNAEDTLVDDDLNTSTSVPSTHDTSLNMSLSDDSPSYPSVFPSKYIHHRPLPIRSLLEDISLSVTEENRRQQRTPEVSVNDIGLFVCGPDGMVNDAQEYVEGKEGEERNRWGFHKEIFKY